MRECQLDWSRVGEMKRNFGGSFFVPAGCSAGRFGTRDLAFPKAKALMSYESPKQNLTINLLPTMNVLSYIIL